MYKLRTYDCTDCGQSTTRRRNTDDPRICIRCGAVRQVQAAIEMSERSGPAYDAWLASNADGASGEKERSA